MDTTRSTAPGRRFVTAVLSATLATAGLGLPATMALADEAATDNATAEQVTTAPTTRVTIKLANSATSASQLLEAINAARAEAGLTALVNDASLEAASYQRAAETCVLDAAVRPDGSAAATAQAAGRTTNEVIVAGTPADAAGALSALTEEQLTLVNDPAATNVGVGVVADSAGALHWVVTLASDSATGEGAFVTSDGDAVYTMSVADANLALVSETEPVEVGVSTTYPLAATAQTTGNVAAGDTELALAPLTLGIDPTGLAWASSDEAVATVDANGTVTGVAAGTATVTATGSLGTVNFTVNVTDGQAAPAPEESADPATEEQPGTPAPETPTTEGKTPVEGETPVEGTEPTSEGTEPVEGAETTPVEEGTEPTGEETTGGEEEPAPIDLSTCTIAGITDDNVYLGEPVAPAFTVIDADYGTVDPNQYTYTFTNNTAPGTATLTVTANPDSTQYTGTISRDFEIKANTVVVPEIAVGTTQEDALAALTNAGLTATAVEGDAAPDEASVGLVYQTDPAAGTEVEAGSAVTATYYGAVATPEAISLEGATVAPISDQTLVAEGTPVEPEVTVTLADGTVLAKDVDYTVEYANNTALTSAENPATVTVTGIGAYTGTLTASFNIVEPPATTTDLAEAGYTIAVIPDQTYTGSAIVPEVALQGATTLVEGTDYEVFVDNNTAVGQATITVKGIGSYTGELKANFAIKGDLSSTFASVAEMASVEYTGSSQTPAPAVKFADYDLTAGTDYEVQYTDNTNAGTAKVTITGVNNYTGTIEASFTISPKSITGSQISPIASATYNGSAQTPGVTVTDGTKVLTAGTDYTVTYENNTNAGSAHVVVNGTGNYTGSIDSSFKIEPLNLNRATIVMPNVAYTGSALTPSPVSVTISNEGSAEITLVQGQDYDIVGYGNNTQVGDAKITLQGKGNFTGTVVANWKIVQQGTTDTGTTETLPQTGDDTNVVPIVVGAVVGVALVGTGVGLIVHRSRSGKRDNEDR